MGQNGHFSMKNNSKILLFPPSEIDHKMTLFHSFTRSNNNYAWEKYATYNNRRLWLDYDSD